MIAPPSVLQTPLKKDRFVGLYKVHGPESHARVRQHLMPPGSMHYSEPPNPHDQEESTSEVSPRRGTWPNVKVAPRKVRPPRRRKPSLRPMPENALQLIKERVSGPSSMEFSEKMATSSSTSHSKKETDAIFPEWDEDGDSSFDQLTEALQGIM